MTAAGRIHRERGKSTMPPRAKLATALALLKQDPKNSAQKSLVKSIREEIRSLQAEPPRDGDGGAAAPVSSDVLQPPQDEPSRVGALDESR